MRLPYVLLHRGANRKLYLIRILYRLHLFRAFLFLYGMMIRKCGVDLKW